MPSIIEQLTVGADSDQSAANQFAAISRPFTGSWTKLRVGVRWYWEPDPGGNLVTGAIGSLGISDGPSTVGGNIVKHGVFYGNFQYSTGLGLPMTYSQTGSNFTVRSSTATSSLGICINSTFPTQIVGGGIFGTFGPIPSSTVIPCSAMWFDIERGTPNYTLRWGSTTGAASVYPTESEFFTQMTSPNPNFTNHNTSLPTTYAIDEATNGEFDHFTVGWNRSIPQMRIMEAIVVKVI